MLEVWLPAVRTASGTMQDLLVISSFAALVVYWRGQSLEAVVLAHGFPNVFRSQPEDVARDHAKTTEQRASRGQSLWLAT